MGPIQKSKRRKRLLGMQGIALGASLGPLPSPNLSGCRQGEPPRGLPTHGRCSPVQDSLGRRGLTLAAHPSTQTLSPMGSRVILSASCSSLHRVSVDPPAEPWPICRMHSGSGELASGMFFRRRRDNPSPFETLVSHSPCRQYWHGSQARGQPSIRLIDALGEIQVLMRRRLKSSRQP